MSTGDRHAAPDEKTEARAVKLGEVIDERFKPSLGEAPGIAMTICQWALQRTSLLLLADPVAEQEETYRSVREVAEAGAAFFKAGLITEGGFSATVGGSSVVLKPLAPVNSKYHVGNWLDSLWAAVICRDRQFVRDLTAVPAERLRVAGLSSPEYKYAWAEALRAFFSGGEDVYPLINRALELTGPEREDVVPEIALYRHVSPMKLLFDVAAGRADEFNAGLREAVDLHRRFWTANGERASRPDGFFALSCTALAAVAYDRGIPVDVESDYLPRHFVEPTWLHRRGEGGAGGVG
jgi:hypothetical protein